MATNDFIGFASSGNANVMSQADYAAAHEQLVGVQPGMASSAMANKVWRQGANMASVIGQLIKNHGIDALDNGDLATLYNALLSATASTTLAGLMSAEDKTKLDNTATLWTDLDTKLMTATVLRSVLYNIVGVAGSHYVDGHIHDLNYQTAMVTIFNGWDDVHRANFPTGAAGKYSVSLLVPLYSDLQNNTPFYEFGDCIQILLSEHGDVWTRNKYSGSWSSWSYKNSVTLIDGTLTKKLDIGVGTSFSNAFRIGAIGFVIIADSFPSVNTAETYYQVYETNLKALKETTSPVFDATGRIVGYAWVNANGTVFIRGLYTGTHVDALYACIQYPVSV